MSTIWKPGEEPSDLFEKGTRVRFLKPVHVNDPMFGKLVNLRIDPGATGTVLRIFPDVRVAVDLCDENPYRIEQVEIDRSALKGGLAPLRGDGKADLKLVT